MIDVIVTWPIHMDYPLFREELAEIHSRSNKIIIAFSDHKRGVSLRNFLVRSMPYAIFVEPRLTEGRDWRDVAVNDALKFSSGTHVLFLEQDFLMTSVFWHCFSHLVDRLPPHLVGWKDDTGRLHPSFLYVQKTLLRQTSLDFSANPPEWDHFGKVSAELLKLANYSDLMVCKGEWMHIGGLTQNYNLVMEGKSPNYNLETFRWYNRFSRGAEVEHIKAYTDLSLKAEEYLETE